MVAEYPKRIDEVFEGHKYGVDAALYHKDKIYLFKVSYIYLPDLNLFNTSSEIVPIEMQRWMIYLKLEVVLREYYSSCIILVTLPCTK